VIVLLIILYLAAFIPRLAAASVFLNRPVALDDMYQYDMLGRSLAEGRGFRWYTQADVESIRWYMEKIVDLKQVTFPAAGLETTFRAPAYPYFLAGIYRLVQPELRIAAARLAQAGLGALLAPLAALLCLRLGMGRRAAILAGLVLGLYPILVIYPVGLATENLFLPLLLAGVLALVWRPPQGGRGELLRFGAAGVLFGLAMLTRSTAALAVLLAGAWLAWRAGKKAALLLLLAAFGVCLPWAARNSLLLKKPTFVETSLGYNLFVGYHPLGDGGFVTQVAVLPLAYVDDAVRDRFCTTKAVEYILYNPAEALRRVPLRAAYFLGFEDRELAYFYGNN
jgi:4-amino-4-deoxy-L-arabinose transferase-like glycosyltransferase